MSAEQLITKHLDIWTSAHKTRSTAGRGSSNKLDLYGIKKLRELILELAVRGKLVPQDPNDEPASELIKRIKREKELAFMSGKRRKQEIAKELDHSDRNFDLPKNWQWIRLSEVISFVNGYAFKSSDFSERGVGVVKIGDISNSGVLTPQTMSRVDESIVNGLDNDLCVRKGDLVIAMSGATTGKLGFNTSDECFYLNQRVGKLVPYLINEHFLFYSLTTKIKENLEKSLGSAIPNLSTAQINDIVLALPPLDEQKRIICKVDELLAFCDDLEQSQTDNITAHAQLVEALLTTLTNSKDNQELQANWQRISKHFDTLLTTEDSIDQLKQTILQLAVMGKLVPQDPNDEPASELLKKIAAEKAQLIKEGKIKKEKPLPEITDEEKPFELPKGWEFERLQAIANVIAGNAFSSEDFSSTGGARVIKITNAGVGEFIETEDYLPIDFIKSASQFLVSEGDFILALTRPYIADGLKISKCPASYNNSLLNQRVAAIKINNLMHTEYYYQFFKSNFVLNVYLNRFGGSGLQPNLKMADVTQLIFAVPPLAEQRRIAAKLEELMSLCESLRANLQHSQLAQLALVDAFIEQAVC